MFFSYKSANLIHLVSMETVSLSSEEFLAISNLYSAYIILKNWSLSFHVINGMFNSNNILQHAFQELNRFFKSILMLTPEVSVNDLLYSTKLRALSTS